MVGFLIFLPPHLSISSFFPFCLNTFIRQLSSLSDITNTLANTDHQTTKAAGMELNLPAKKDTSANTNNKNKQNTHIKIKM